MHGKQFHPTWSRLASSINAGEDRIYLQDKVNWEPGQKVVLTTTFYFDRWWDQNEVLVIKAVDRNIVQFTTNVRFPHYGGREYQAEVGLLSRRILVQGDEKSEEESFGGHILSTGQARLSGVQAYRMGQTNRLARSVQMP